MNVRASLRGPALGSALAMGVLADLLLQVPGRPGLNLALWAVAGVAAIALVLWRRAEPAARESRWMIGGALAFAIAIALRDAEALAVIAILAAMLLLGLAAGRAAQGWARQAQVSDLAAGALRVGLLCAAGPMGWGRAEGAASGWAVPARTFLRGAVIASPALLVLAALLMSADPVFAGIVRALFVFEVEALAEHLVFIAVVAWLTAGFLRALAVRDEIAAGLPGLLPQPSLAAGEVVVALWLLNLLFAAFMLVQLRYLFGGAGLVEVTPGLGYADYARRGFFELVACAALVLPLLLAADWAAAAQTPRARTALRASMLVLVALLVGVIASAAYRMGLYQQAYGLTEQRLYVSVFIVWLALVLAWLVATVLRGRRERFAFGAMVLGLACIAALQLLNPHAVIARVNLERAASGFEYDGDYLRSLSADAVPAMLDYVDRLPGAERCRMGETLQARWGGTRAGDWRSWNLGEWRARRLVAQMATSACSPTGP